MQEKLDRMEKRLARMERLLNEVVRMVPATEITRLTEKEVCAKYNVSKHLLRRLRLGYKRIDGVEIPAVLFKWGHRNGRNFDYDREEIDQVLGRVQI